jgi:predicted Holliday junction resolvase-like endonuclease
METLSIIPVHIILLFCLFVLLCLLFLLIGRRIGVSQGRRQERAEWETHKVEEIVRTRLKASRAVIGGLVSEQLAPLLPGFPYNPGDCRFIGKPVDFLVFRGMNEKEISEVIFLEVKSGASKALNDQEKRLKDTILAGRVGWAEYDVG